MRNVFEIYVYPNYSAYIFYFKMYLIRVFLNLFYVAHFAVVLRFS